MRPRTGVADAIGAEYKEPMDRIDAPVRFGYDEELAPDGPPGLGFVGIYRPRGEGSLAEVVALIRTAVEHCRRCGVTRVLVNATWLTGFSIPSLVDRFLLAEELAQAADGLVAAALVVREEYIDPEKFGVAAAAHFGFKVDVFSCETEALTWISNLAEPS